MNHGLTHIAVIIGFAIGSLAPTAVAQTTANGPYYATPSWDQQLPASTRFIVLSNWGNAAVLDRETGLVWEQSPSTTTGSWLFAEGSCVQLLKGGRYGWRLPTIQEIASLIDPQSFPSLPSGHPFAAPSRAGYWSATSNASEPNFAWTVDLFFFPNPFINVIKSATGLEMRQAWCVRGGQGVDPQ